MTPRPVRRIVVVGTALGILSLAMFAFLHSLVVKPIWSQLAGGIPFVVAIGMAVTWAYDEFGRAVPLGPCTRGGLRFGAMMWLSSLPAVAFASLMRVKLGGPLLGWMDVVAGLLAVGGGAGVIGVVTRSRRASVAAAAASLALLTAGGGPLPILRGGRVLELWFGLFVVETLGGAMLAHLHRRWIATVAPPPA